MTVLLHLFDSTSAGWVAEIAAGALIAGLWQGIVLAAAMAFALRVLPRTTATVRFAVWTAVFVVSAALPVAHLDRAVAPPIGVASWAGRVQVDVRWSYLLAGLWVVAAAWRMGALAVQAIELRTIWRSAAPAAGYREMSGRRRVRVCTSDAVDRPSVIGFFAPRILIPTWLFEQLSAVELEHIVLHELEHLRRRDDWVNLMQKVGLVLFPLSPALLWIDRRLSVEREIACDDGVLERTKTPRAYAASLTSIAERRLDERLHRRVAALALAAIGSSGWLRRRSEFSRRIETILERRSVASPAMAGGVGMLLVAVVLCSAVELARAPRLVSFRAAVAPLQAAAVVPQVSERPVQARYSASVRDVVFHPARPVSVAKRRKRAAAVYQTPARTPVVEDRGEMFVLADWRQRAPVARVYVKMPDGQVFATQYAAVPTQAGWIVVQL